eukprot:14810648-Alexandrium_andersonii.AAC.1
MPIAALLSAYTRRPAEKPRSKAMEAMPMPSAAPLTMPASSAPPSSARSFLLGGPVPNGTRSTRADPPRVDRRARRQPAKSASTNAWIAAPSSRQGKL